MEEIRKMRLSGLVETADYYLWVSVDNPKKKWSDAQKKQVQETINALSCFSEVDKSFIHELEKIIA